MFFSNESKAKKEEESFLNLYSAFLGKWELVKTSYSNGDQLYNQIANSLAQISSNIENIDKYYTKKNEKLRNDLFKAQEEANKPVPTGEEAAATIEAQTNDLIKKIRHFDSLKSHMKDILKKVNGKKLAKLKVNENPALLKFFNTIFTVFYQQKDVVFDWKKFSQFSFIEDKCDQFALTLVPPDYSNFTDDQVTEIAKIKGDPAVLQVAREDPNADNLLDLLDFLEYFAETVQTQREINSMRKDLEVAKHEVFTNEIMVDVRAQKLKLTEDHIEYLDKLQDKFSDMLGDLEKGTNKLKEIDGIYAKRRQDISTSIPSKVSGQCSVPNSIYNDSK